MNSAVLLIPLFLIRYGLLSLINKNALPKAAYFPPMQGTEKIMYLLYQVSTLAIIIYMFFLKIISSTPWLYIGAVVYALGVLLFIFSVAGFAKPDEHGICRNRLYRISRNPMYVAYFVYFLGCVFLTGSVVLLLLLCVFGVSSHWIVLSEERWCTQKFGAEYVEYMKKVRRYI